MKNKQNNMLLHHAIATNGISTVTYRHWDILPLRMFWREQGRIKLMRNNVNQCVIRFSRKRQDAKKKKSCPLGQLGLATSLVTPP